MKEHMQALKDLYAPLPGDSQVVRKSKAEIAATLAGENQFEFEGRTYPCQTKEQAMHSLGLNRRWNTVPQRRTHESTQDLPL